MIISQLTIINYADIVKCKKFINRFESIKEYITTAYFWRIKKTIIMSIHSTVEQIKFLILLFLLILFFIFCVVIFHIRD